MKSLYSNVLNVSPVTPAMETVNLYMAPENFICSYEVVTTKNLLAETFDFMSSIVLVRNHIREILKDHYEFKNENLEIDFIAEDNERLDVLLDFKDFFVWNSEEKLELELFEDESFETLFINFSTNFDIDKSFEIYNSSLEKILDLPNTLSQVFNFSLIPYEA